MQNFPKKSRVKNPKIPGIENPQKIPGGKPEIPRIGIYFTPGIFIPGIRDFLSLGIFIPGNRDFSLFRDFYHRDSGFFQDFSILMCTGPVLSIAVTVT